MKIQSRAVAVIAASGMWVALFALPAVAETNRASHSPAPVTASSAPAASTSPQAKPSHHEVAPASSTAPFSAPSASPAPSKKSGLTADQKVALAAALSAYATAVANARDGFSRAVADAKSVMDQSIAAAGKDRAAIALAKQTFKDSYNQIFQALSAGLNSAKAAYEAAKQAIIS